ncbi:uncharacterized protein [Panulirus ornatus]
MAPQGFHVTQAVADVQGPHSNTSVENVEGQVPALLPDNCECKSLFTVGACGLEAVAGMRPGDAAWASAVASLGRARKRQDVLMMPSLATLARYLPQVFRINLTSGQEVEADLKVSRASTTLPFLTCRVHLYTPAEVLACTRHYRSHRAAPLRIAFVGDSRVRNTMQQMIRSTMHRLGYRLEGEHQDLDATLAFLDSKTKANVPVLGEGLELRLHWSAFLEQERNGQDVSRQGARDLLEAWASGSSGPRDGPIPDIVYVTSGFWDTSMSPEDDAVSDFLHTLHVMTPILQTLARRTRVLWHVHGPIKAWLARRGVPNAALDMMNRASWARLDRAGVWLWDSRTILTLRQMSECRALHLAGLVPLLPATWGCQDFQHAGRDVEDAAANMLWNLACNDVLGLATDHCCAT